MNLPNRKEVMQSLESFAGSIIPSIMKKEEEYWQPTDLLPRMGEADSLEKIRDLQEHAQEHDDDVMAVLVGDMVTEEALPTYTGWIAATEGFTPDGEPKSAWAEWLRKWSAEENRHGDALNRYLYLSGRVNMREVECTVQNLIIDGGDIGVSTDPYKVFVYTAFQEIATRISHGNVAAKARKAGDELLGKLCAFIASDEQRHATAYKDFFKKCIEVDPNNAMLAFHEMMKRRITMPAMFMRERGMQVGETFKRFAEVAERQKIYTPIHYAEIMESLVKYWDIANLKGLNDKAEAAQQYVCALPERYRKIAERLADRVSWDQRAFTWLNARPVVIHGAQV